MKKLFISTVIVVAMITVSCEVIDTLSESEVIQGLKEALNIGSQSASKILGKTDGYYGDELVKILLPPEADVIVENIRYIPGGDALIEDLIKSINRSAEDAATEVVPIFKGAITDMTIQDGFNILKGDSTAATQYLKTSTYSGLFELYQPKIDVALGKPFVGSTSTNDVWASLTGKWNTFAESLAGELLDFKPVNTNLSDFLTNEALDGLFLKLADEEVKIRTDPAARVTDILKKVFGSEEAQGE
ncbi:MAG: DUF4197 domain-containing protein [Cytophagaceae bacterium]|nr:DUF4197 domain-containing protein [Cytophagaceae bacterium]